MEQQLEQVAEVAIACGSTPGQPACCGRIFIDNKTRTMILNVYSGWISETDWKTLINVIAFKIGDQCTIYGQFDFFSSVHAIGKIASFNKKGVFIIKPDGSRKLYNYTKFCGLNH